MDEELGIINALISIISLSWGVLLWRFGVICPLSARILPPAFSTKCEKKPLKSIYSVKCKIAGEYIPLIAFFSVV
jgi:hypothetical protein